MTRLWWVRHGPTHQKAFTGWRDVPADLSDHAALARLDAFLPPDARLISSDLIRASATADALAERIVETSDVHGSIKTLSEEHPLFHAGHQQIHLRI